MIEKRPQNGRSLRSDLIILLSQACELEHSFACSFLFTACSLKQSLEEGITRRQLELTHRWAEDLLDVALGKMLHFAQVWNLFTAVGCNPYHWRPNFPIPANYYPTGLPIELLPFGAVALERCLQSEVPDQGMIQSRNPEDSSNDEFRQEQAYGSVAQLYSVLSRIIETIPEEELFIGNPARQVGHMFPDFSSLVPVFDRASAFRAIDLLRGKRVSLVNRKEEANEYSETRLSRNRHYEVLLRLQEEFRAEQQRAKQANERFEISRDVIENPVLKEGVDYRVPIITQPQVEQVLVGRQIQEPYTQRVAQLFEQAYSLMLGQLQYVFRNVSSDSSALQLFSESAMGLFPSVLKPLSESLMLLPAGNAWGRQAAGPTFGISRYIPLHPKPSIAIGTVQARLKELIVQATELAKDDRVTAQLLLARRNLEDLRDRLRDGQSAFATKNESNTI